MVTDPEVRRKLTPDTPWGCLRPLFSNDYYPTFNRPNVELVTDAIERITPTGIVTVDGTEREVDVIVFATGYEVDKFASRIPISGRGRALPRRGVGRRRAGLPRHHHDGVPEPVHALRAEHQRRDRSSP